MSRRFLDVFMISFLFNMIMIIIILVLSSFGINVIVNIVITLFLVAIISIFISYMICKFPVDVLSYKLGFTKAGIEYRKTLVNIAKCFEDKTHKLYDEIENINPASLNDIFRRMYLYASIDSRNELIEKLTIAFDKIDDFSNEDLKELET